MCCLILSDFLGRACRRGKRGKKERQARFEKRWYVKRQQMQQRWGNKEGARGERKQDVKVRGGGGQGD